MIKVSIIKVYQPNVFLGTDLALFDKICQSCIHIRSTDSLLLPCSDITPQMVFLYDHNNQLMRVRVLSAINPNTFRCLLIDHGRIEEVKKHRMFVIPMNQLQMDPAVKLYKITGIAPAGLHISNEGVNIKATLSESKEWIRASYKFVCRIFQESPFVNVVYLKECSKDKVLVDVYVNYKDNRENLKDLLIREHYAFALPDNLNNSLESGLSHLSLDCTGDKVDEDLADSLSAESVSKLLEEFKDDDLDSVSSIQKIADQADTSVTPDTSDNLTTNQSTYGTLDEISAQILNNKVKSWLVVKSLEVNGDNDSLATYQYKNPVRPILSYQNDQMIAPFLRDTMIYHKTKSLLLIQALMFPAILRGINVMAIAPTKKGKSMGLMMPVLQKIATKPLSNNRAFNPLAIILCTSWKKVKESSDSANIFIGFINESPQIRKPRVVAAYAGQVEKKIMIQILQGCDILIITPKCLLRLLKTHEFFKLNELEILCLDDCEDLIADNLSVLKEIFIYKQTGSIESGNEVQLIATGTHWTSGLQSFLKNEMGTMFMLTVNNPLEMAIFEGLKQKLIEYDKRPMDLFENLATYLEMTESKIKRTIIFASDDHQIRTIYTYLMQKLTFDLKVMLGSMSGTKLRQVEQEWNQYRGYVTMPVLLISDEALGRNDISIFNAHTLLHADVNPPMFGPRLNFLRDKFHELPFLDRPSADRDCHSFVFLCADTIDLCHANFLYKFLGRCHSDRPEWLKEKAVDFILNKEKSKVVNEICSQIKVKGECEFPACTKRHMVVSDVDKPLLPNRGQIKFRLLYLVSPSNFFVRIIEHKVPNEAANTDYKTQYTSLKMAMIKYFSDPANVHGANPRTIQRGSIAAIRVKDMLERVQVLKLKVNKSTKANVKLIDHGSTMLIDPMDLLILPKELIDVPAQAVEVYLTGIRPLDSDEHYHAESCSFAEEFLEGHDLYGVIMLCIGKTLWVDSVTQLMHHKSINISVYDKNLSVELVEKDYVERNPGHIQKLIRLCTGKIDIWNSASQSDSRAPVAIMRKFTYADEPLKFDELLLQEEGDEIKNECVVLRVLSPDVIFLSNRDTKESIKQMQNEIKSLIDSIETLPFNSVRSGSRVLFSSDSDWLRGYVLKVEEESALILSLDWSTVITYTTKDLVLKKLPTEYQELPYHAIMVGLCYCCPGQAFSDDANQIIENFVCSSSDKKLLLNVTAYSLDEIDYRSMFVESSDNETMFRDLDLFQTLKRYSVSIAKKALKDDDEELFNVLVQKRCVIPAQTWIHMVLPECQPFLSRLERSGSIPHLGLDVLSTRDYDKRLKLSMTIERIIIKHISFFEDNLFVPCNVDAILHTLSVLLHFVQEQQIFMCYYRSLVALLSIAYKKKLPLNNLKSDEAFTIRYISNLLCSYHSIVYHMLHHLNMTITDGRLADSAVFLDMFKLLLVDGGFVNNFFGEDNWMYVMSLCICSMATDETLYCCLMDILVQLLMLFQSSRTDDPVLAGILRQSCRALVASQSAVIWAASLSLIGCLVHNRLYYQVFRDLDWFVSLLTKIVDHYRASGHWTEVHQTAMDMLAGMWQNGSVDRDGLLARDLGLSATVYSFIKARVPGHQETLARLHTELVVAESATVPGTTTTTTTINGSGSGSGSGSGASDGRVVAGTVALAAAAVVPGTMALIPELDAADWMAVKDNGLLKKHKKSYRRIYENKTSMDDSSDDDNDGNGSVQADSSDSSDLEAATFLKNYNPADEDNVHCYDRP